MPGRVLPLDVHVLSAVEAGANPTSHNRVSGVGSRQSVWQAGYLDHLLRGYLQSCWLLFSFVVWFFYIFSKMTSKATLCCFF